METGSEEPEKQEPEKLGTRAEVEVLGACKRKIKAAIPLDKVSEALEKNYKELAQTIQLPGFRRGRVPRRLLEARFGAELEEDLKEALLATSLGEVIEEKGLQVLGAPKFDNVQFKKDADLTYEVELEVRPEFEVGEYKGIEVTRESIPIAEADVEVELKSLRESRGQAVAIDASSAGSDDIFAGKCHLVRDGIRVKTLDHVHFVPSKNVVHMFSVPDLAEKVKAWNATSGSALVLDVKVPNDFPDEVLRGVDLKLEFHCEEVERIELPELDDAFAKEFGKKSLDELKAEVRESVEAQARRKEDQKIAATVLEKVLASVSIELPEGLLEGQKARWMHNREYELLAEQGMPAEKVKETLAKEAEAAGEEFRRGLKEYFVLERIADKEKIFATEEEVDKRLRLMATLYGVPAARLRDEMRKTERLEELRYVLRHEKVREFLGKRARVLGPDGKPEEPPPEEVAPDSGAPAEPASPAPESRTEGEFGT